MSNENHVYEVKIGSAVKAYAEAESPAKAKALALADLTVRRLSGGEIGDLFRRGETILVAGRVTQPGLPLGDGDAAQAPQG